MTIAQPSIEQELHAVERPTGRSRRAVGWFNDIPLTSRILIANVGIVLVGAAVGTLVTLTVAHHTGGKWTDALALLLAITGITVSVSVNYLVLRAAFKPINNLNEVALALRSGSTEARVEIPNQGDRAVRDILTTFNEMLDQLEIDRSELRTLASKVISAQEEERRRIARELHDDTAQVLFAQLLAVGALKEQADPATRAVGEQLESMTVDAIEGVRRLALELRPPALDDLGLEEAVGSLANRFTEATGIPVHYQARGFRTRISPDAELVLYRVAQEALANARKHAQPSTVTIQLERPGDVAIIMITDDGRGFSQTSQTGAMVRTSGLGLFGMHERVSLVGGTLVITSGPSMGTTIRASVPAPLSAHPGGEP